MSKQSKFVTAAFLKLNAEEQAEVQKQIKEVADAPGWKKPQLSEGMIKEGMDLGPVGSGKCPYCGK